MIESGGTALAVAAEPTLGSGRLLDDDRDRPVRHGGGDERRSVPGGGVVRGDGGHRSVPAGDGHPPGGAGASRRLSVTAVSAALLAVFFDLSAIASIGSVVALVVFSLITVGHIRVRHETGANVAVLAVAIVSTVAVLVAFVFTTLVDEPATAVTLGGHHARVHRRRRSVEVPGAPPADRRCRTLACRAVTSPAVALAPRARKQREVGVA